MRAFLIQHDVSSSRANQGQLVVSAVAKPDISKDEVLINVHACGLNRADIFQRQGNYPPPKGASEIPGLEVSGVVEMCGADVRGFAVGDKVCALLEGGGYAEYVAVKASQILPVPKYMDVTTAAALPEVFFTVWYNLFEKAKLHAHETVLVHGASSGVGMATMALCRLLDIDCIATTTSPQKIQELETFGARHVLESNADLVARVKQLTDGKGVDVILDMVGGEMTSSNLKMLAYGGRLAMIALLAGAKAEVNLGALLLKNLTITGATLRNQPWQVKAAIASALQADIWPKMEAKAYQPHIARIFAFEEAYAAQQFMEENRHIGKILLQLR